MDMPVMMEALELRFAPLMTGRDHIQRYRMKPHGWEYRRLPATVDPVEVTEFLRMWTRG